MSGFGVTGVSGGSGTATTPVGETPAFELGHARTSPDRAPVATVVAALRGGEPAELTASSSTPMRRPPQAFLVRGTEGEEVRVRITVGQGDGALERVDGRSRLETRLADTASAVFGSGAGTRLSSGTEAALSSALPAANREVAPFVEVSARGEQRLGAMVMGQGLIAYLGLDERGVSASVVSPGEPRGGLSARLSSSAIEVDGRTVPLASETTARLGDVLSRLSGITERPSLRDDVHLLSSGAIPV